MGNMVGVVDKRSPATSVMDSRTRRFMWVEFVAGSLLAARVSLWFLRFSFSMKTNTSKFQIPELQHGTHFDSRF